MGEDLECAQCAGWAHDPPEHHGGGASTHRQPHKGSLCREPCQVPSCPRLPTRAPQLCEWGLPSSGMAASPAASPRGAPGAENGARMSDQGVVGRAMPARYHRSVVSAEPRVASGVQHPCVEVHPADAVVHDSLDKRKKVEHNPIGAHAKGCNADEARIRRANKECAK